MANFEWNIIREKASTFSAYTGPAKPMPYEEKDITLLVKEDGTVIYGLEYLNSLPGEVMVKAMVAQGEMTEAEADNYAYLSRLRNGDLTLEEIQNIPINYGNTDSKEEESKN